jgi:hypothetical protein
MMQEYTPPNSNSIFEDDEEEPSAFLKALRLVNDGMHALACLVLLLIMAFFLKNVPDVLSRTTGYVTSLLLLD